MQWDTLTQPREERKCRQTQRFEPAQLLCPVCLVLGNLNSPHFISPNTNKVMRPALCDGWSLHCFCGLVLLRELCLTKQNRLCPHHCAQSRVSRWTWVLLWTVNTHDPVLPPHCVRGPTGTTEHSLYDSLFVVLVYGFCFSSTLPS